MEKLSVQFAKLEEKIDAAKAKVEQKKAEDKVKIETSIDETKTGIANSEKEIRDWADETKDKGFSDVLNIKSTIEEKKQEFATKRAEKKYESEKHKKAASVEYAMESASFYIELALMAIDEATLATLECIASELEYEETYGEPVDFDVE